MRSRGVRGVPPRRSSPRSSRRACKRRRTIRARRSAAARAQPRLTRTGLLAGRAAARSRARGTAIPPATWSAAVDAASRRRSALMLTNSRSRPQRAIAATAATARRRASASATASGAALSDDPTWGLGGCRSTRFRHLTNQLSCSTEDNNRRIGPQIPFAASAPSTAPELFVPRWPLGQACAASSTRRLGRGVVADGRPRGCWRERIAPLGYRERRRRRRREAGVARTFWGQPARVPMLCR
jgi:hypothetical protein